MNIPQITEGKPNRGNKNKKHETGRSCTINRSAEHRCQSSTWEKTIEETARDSFHPPEDRSEKSTEDNEGGQADSTQTYYCLKQSPTFK